MDCMCRVCETIYGLKNMFDEENEELLLMLRSVANISIFPNDLLPKYICEFCSHKLQKSYEFKVQCEATDQKLREIIEHLTKTNIVPVEEKPDNRQPVIEKKKEIKQEIETVATKRPPIKPQSGAIVIVDSEDEETMNNFDNMVSDECDEFSEEDEKEKMFEEEMKQLFGNVSILHRKQKSTVIDTVPEISKAEIEAKLDAKIHAKTSAKVDAKLNAKVPEPKVDPSITYQEIIINGENIDDLIIEDYSEDFGVNESTEGVNESAEGGENLETKSEVASKEERTVEFESVIDSTDKSSLGNGLKKSNTQSQIINEPKVYKCPVCSEIFPTGLKLSQHKRNHNKWKNKCNICQKTFVRTSALKDHMMMHAGKKLICELCGAKLSHRANLVRHIQTCHESVKPYQCDVCGMFFARRSSMKAHKYTHTEVRAFACECGKSFKTKMYLRIHQRKRHPLENGAIVRQEPELYICPYCGKNSTALPTHLNHLRIHSGVKPFECQECPKKFRFKHFLSRHMLVHTGERPFKCEICDKTFRQQPHLQTHHRAVHLGARPYQCKFCQKRFTGTGTLKIHERIHTGERPFECEQCGQGFIEKKALKKHNLSNKCLGKKAATQFDQSPVEDNPDEDSATFTEEPGESIAQLQIPENDDTAELEIYLQDIHNDYAEIIEVES